MAIARRARRRGFGDMHAAATAAVAAFGVLILLLLTAADAPSQTAAAGWAARIEKSLASEGFGWIRLRLEDRVAMVGGEAPNVDARRYGFEAAETEILRAPEAAQDVAVVIDATTLAGAPADLSLGAALARLPPSPTAADCNSAMAAVLAGRSVEFELGSANLSRDNRRLLDALTAATIRCRAHRIEIGGHTDLAGSAGANLRLSRARADAVKVYLVGRGAPADALQPVGYGETRPKVNARTPAADALNRRIEFQVSVARQ